LISFDQTDHPSSIPKHRRFPLKDNPLVWMTQLSKALMDGSSGLNLMYLNTFELIGLAHDQLQSSPHPFYGVVPCKQSVPLRWVNLPVTIGDVSNYHTVMIAFKVADFSIPYHIILYCRG
jgi:hypothetical protein